MFYSWVIQVPDNLQEQEPLDKLGYHGVFSFISALDLGTTGSERLTSENRGQVGPQKQACQGLPRVQTARARGSGAAGGGCAVWALPRSTPLREGWELEPGPLHSPSILQKQKGHICFGTCVCRYQPLCHGGCPDGMSFSNSQRPLMGSLAVSEQCHHSLQLHCPWKE